MRPEIGVVFTNPRGRKYAVIGHMLDPSKVVVRDVASGMCDTATWELMVPGNGWEQMPTSTGERAAVVACLRAYQYPTDPKTWADLIEKGEHLKDATLNGGDSHG